MPRRIALALLLCGIAAAPLRAQTPGSLFPASKPTGGPPGNPRDGKSAEGRTPPSAPVPVPSAGPVKSPALPTGCNRDTFRIALDIGHDPTKPGATAASGATEFGYNQSLGRLALTALQAEGFRAAFAIGGDNAPMPLLRRTRIARERGAMAFVSLHHDSAQKQFFTERMVNGRSLPYSDAFHGYSIFVSATAPGAREGMALATALGQALRARGLTPSPHHAMPIPGEGRVLLDRDLGIYRFDELAVLRTATMPALLLESGVIVNRAEEAAIQSGQYHPRIVAALVEALSRFCAATPSASPLGGPPRQ